MIFSGWVTHGPNAALSIATKWLSLCLLRRDGAAPSMIALAVEHVGDRQRRAFAQLLLGRRDVEDAAIGAHAEAVAVLNAASVANTKPRAIVCGADCGLLRERRRSLVNGTPAAAAAPAKRCRLQERSAILVIIASLDVLCGPLFGCGPSRQRRTGLRRCGKDGMPSTRNAGLTQTQPSADPSPCPSAGPRAARRASRRASG